MLRDRPARGVQSQYPPRPPRLGKDALQPEADMEIIEYIILLEWIWILLRSLWLCRVDSHFSLCAIGFGLRYSAIEAPQLLGDARVNFGLYIWSTIFLLIFISVSIINKPTRLPRFFVLLGIVLTFIPLFFDLSTQTFSFILFVGWGIGLAVLFAFMLRLPRNKGFACFSIYKAPFALFFFLALDWLGLHLQFLPLDRDILFHGLLTELIGATVVGFVLSFKAD